MANIDTAKQWFETGDYPTQAQFHQTFDWLRWKDEKIGTGDLDPALLAIINSYGRTQLLPDGTYQYTAPAGTLIDKFFIGEWPALHGPGSFTYTVSVGITPGGTELFDSVTVDVGADPNSGILKFDGYYCLADTTFYFTCTPMSGANKALIKIYKN